MKEINFTLTPIISAGKALGMRRIMNEALIACFIIASSSARAANDDCELKCDPKEKTQYWEYHATGAAHPTQPDGEKRIPHYHTWEQNKVLVKKKCFWNEKRHWKFTYPYVAIDLVQYSMKSCVTYRSWLYQKGAGSK